MSADPRAAEYRKTLDDAKEKFYDRLADCPCPRSTFDNFELESLIGKGGFGKVFKAKFKPEGWTVALKVMIKSFLAQRRKAELVVREREFQLSMQSAFIVSLICAFKDHTYVYLALEFASMSTLTWHVHAAAGLQGEIRRHIAGMIILGIEYLHACNILYRDLKPDNVLVFADGYVKLGDFGISIIHHKFASDCIGTVPYMAPEMFMGDYQVDGVDWWALGVLMYEMYTKKWVFGPNNRDPNRIGLIQAAVPVFDHPDVPEVVLNFVSSLLVKDVKKRLGCLVNGSDDVKNHEYFKGINFYDLYEKKIEVDMQAYDTVYYDPLKEADIPEQDPSAESYDTLFERF